MDDKKIEKLVEIKKGQKEGTGLLIESDGYVSKDVTPNNKKIITEAFDSIQNGEWNIPNPFVLDVVLQKYGIKNANGRIYPEDILKREVEKYQQQIKERSALGECYSDDALCLTPDGYKKLSIIKEGDEIITLNTSSNTVETQKVTYKLEFNWNSFLIHIHSNDIDDYVTPSHGFPLYNDEHNFVKFISAQELIDLSERPHLYIPNQLDNVNCGIYLDDESLSIEHYQYKGKVYCVEVPNHTWFVKQNDKEHWTKNCNHPAESTIDLGRISHNIIECHWEGHTLIGKIEFNLTEGFRRYGICSSLGDTCANLIINGYKIGVSSRGVGSVKTDAFGNTKILDDFELVCFDVVSQPSTPGAYIGSREELQQYIESDESKENKSKLFEKINKIKNIL
jgi:hypothetical protein